MVGIALENNKLVVLASAATASGLLIAALWYKKYVKNQPPTKWRKIGEIKDLCIYPVKSFKAVKTPAFECTPLGPRVSFMRDRSFMVVNLEGKFVTGRDYSKMTTLVPEISGSSLVVSCPDFPEKLTVHMDKIEGKTTRVTIWGTDAEGVDCGDEAARWISKAVLGEESGLRLLFCGLDGKGKEVNHRLKTYSKMVDVELQKTDGGFFSDGVSYHLISEASIAELNSRLDGAQVQALNFRPNLIVAGELLIPFEEDNWKWVKVGDAVFQCLAPCTRCLFTTVDPNTGEKSEKMEPLASLRRYRYVRNESHKKVLTSPAMGIYLGLRTEGTVSLGDAVFIPEV